MAEKKKKILRGFGGSTEAAARVVQQRIEREREIKRHGVSADVDTGLDPTKPTSTTKIPKTSASKAAAQKAAIRKKTEARVQAAKKR